MAIIERPADAPAVIGEPAASPPALVTPTAALGVFKRPVSTTGWKSWVFTVDHKRLGIMYGAVSLFFFLVGGSEALLIRLVRRQHGAQCRPVQPDVTMHATTMVFLFVMPMAAAFANYLVPHRRIGPPSTRWVSGCFSRWPASTARGSGSDGGWFVPPNRAAIRCRRLHAGL